MIHEKGRDDFSLVGYQYLPPNLQDQASSGDQVVQNTVGGLALSKRVTEMKLLKIWAGAC